MLNVNIIICAVSANLKNKEKYVLSCVNDKIIFPNFQLSDSLNLESTIEQYVNSYFIDNTIKLDTDQIHLLGINNTIINNLYGQTNDTINIVYGLTIPPYTTNSGYVWQTFDFMDISIPNELTLIGETIRYGF